MPPAIDATIARCLAGTSASAGALVLQVVAEAAPSGGKLWLGKLIELLAPFGVNERLVRTCVFRLSRQGALHVQREGRHSACGITTAVLPQQVDSEAAPWDRDWTLVMGRAGELGAADTATLRKRLWRDGFRTIVAGVLARPGNEAATLRPVLEQLGLQRKLWVFHTTELAGVSARPLAELVNAAWDLSAARIRYQELLDRFAPALARMQAAPQLAPPQAFMLRTLLLCAWRRAQRHDPQLPPALLPRQWHGARAAALCRQLCELTGEGASAHLAHTLAHATNVHPACS
jgi:phenylacetic acid degradation operon negative regulatory protein